MVNSGIFGQTAKFGQRPFLFHISNIGIKNLSTKQTVKILMRRLMSSGFTLFANVCPNLPDVRVYPTLPYVHTVEEGVVADTIPCRQTIITTRNIFNDHTELV